MVTSQLVCVAPTHSPTQGKDTCCWFQNAIPVVSHYHTISLQSLHSLSTPAPHTSLTLYSTLHTPTLLTRLSMPQHIPPSSSRSPAARLNRCGLSEPQLHHTAPYNSRQPCIYKGLQCWCCCNLIVQLLLLVLLAALLLLGLRLLLLGLLLGCKLGCCCWVEQVDSCRQATAGRQ